MWSTSSADFHYTLGRPVQALDFLKSLGSIQPLHRINCQAHQSTIAITAYSQVPIYTWVEWDSGYRRICAFPPCHIGVLSLMPYPLCHDMDLNHQIWTVDEHSWRISFAIATFVSLSDSLIYLTSYDNYIKSLPLKFLQNFSPKHCSKF